MSVFEAKVLPSSFSTGPASLQEGQIGAIDDPTEVATRYRPAGCVCTPTASQDVTRTEVPMDDNQCCTATFGTECISGRGWDDIRR